MEKFSTFQKYKVNEEGNKIPLFRVAYSRANKIFVAKAIKNEKITTTTHLKGEHVLLTKEKPQEETV